MGSGYWFKTIISLKKPKDNSSKQGKGSSASAKSNGFRWKSRQHKGSASSPLTEDLAASRIQTAIRAYLARKNIRCLRGAVRLKNLTQNSSVQKQATTMLNHLHSWSKVQEEIRARRQCMVSEGRQRMKRLENQLKLEAKLHDLEVEWSGGSETMEETVARIHQREEAAVKRERAMAYAFSHQWRANCSQYLGAASYDVGKANWGWSWKERWIAARPWESRVPAHSASPKKVQKEANKGAKKTNAPATTKTTTLSKPSLSNGKGKTKPQRLSYPAAEKGSALEGSIKAKEANCKGDELIVSRPLSSHA